MQRPALVVLASVLLATTAIAQDRNKKNDPDAIGDRDVGKCINIYSIDKEIALGKQLADEVTRQARMFDDPTIGEYVNRLGQNLVRNSDAKVPVTFRVIDADDLNAFALPGGFIFVHTGLLKVAETEAELAGAMAHEVAHVAARHMTCQATKSQIAQILSLPAMMIGGWTGYIVRQGAGLAIPMSFLKLDRKYESEADYLGLQYMYKAGYDPTASVDLFERMLSLEKTRPGTISKVFSTHPPNGDRLQKTQKEINAILPAKPEYVVNTSEYMDMRVRLFALQNHRKNQQVDPDRPRLRTAPGGGGGPIEDSSQDKQDKDDRPTLQRRELVE
jgi:predicted Zn-dependent protease